MWPSGLRQQVANLSCCANTQHREFESHRLRQVIKWAVGIVGNTVALQASVIGSIPIRSTKLLGLKVFMDAHDTVTVEEGDRYPLRPPSY